MSQFPILSDGVDQYTINKFLCEIFSNDKKLQGKVCLLVTESASRKFDMKEEVFSCYYSCSIL